MKRCFGRTILLLVFGVLTAVTAWSETVSVGHLVDFTGPTGGVGAHYGPGVIDALNYVNANGGINGKQVEFDTVDYSYKADRAVATYKKWKSGLKPVVIQGWGTADTEALVRFIARDKVTYISASYSGHLTDPTGKSPHTKGKAPYNFFYGPSYSDGCRGLVQWAMDDWKAKGSEGKPKFAHMGDNHPYPNAPKAACGAYAEELGFEILPAIVFSMKPADNKAQCLSLKDSAADYAFLGNTSGSNISLIKSCDTVGVEAQFLANIWGWDENGIEAAQESGDGIAWVVAGTPWDAGASDNATMKSISAMSAKGDAKYRGLHYIRGVCSTMFMVDAMKMADKKGKLNGTGIKQAMETMQSYVPAGLEGVCLPSTWTSKDHRGTTLVSIYKSEYNKGDFKMSKQATVDVPRRDEWLGW
ncbi:MAG: ABC transporter substrate-binding protein [Thermodesulfobacteriota bacterium]|nr:ABC transporter substrate-binding protein [Thermodesulfobacteriota bacterium]